MWIIHLCHLFRNTAQIQPPVCPPSASTQQLQALWQTDICSSVCEAANRTEVLQRQESQWLQANSLIHFNQVQCRCDLRIMRAVYNSSLHALRGLFDECVYQREEMCTAYVIWTLQWVCQVFLFILEIVVLRPLQFFFFCLMSHKAFKCWSESSRYKIVLFVYGVQVSHLIL